jgi:hypothetical protein
MNQILRDKQGGKIGEIQDQGTRQIIRDAQGRKLGEYDGRVTRDAQGRKIGDGNLLTTLLKPF